MHLSAFGVLAFNDPPRERERQLIDTCAFTCGELGERILEVLRKARHVHAAVLGVEIGINVERRKSRSLRAQRGVDSNERLHACNPRAIEREGHLGARLLHVAANSR